MPPQHFSTEAIKVAVAFATWSEETGQGLTISTFVNTFWHKGNKGGTKAMYDAVKRIFEATLPSMK